MKRQQRSHVMGQGMFEFDAALPCPSIVAPRIAEHRRRGFRIIRQLDAHPDPGPVRSILLCSLDHERKAIEVLRAWSKQ